MTKLKDVNNRKDSRGLAELLEHFEQGLCEPEWVFDGEEEILLGKSSIFDDDDDDD
jgi:hypothetical protein